MTLRTFFAAVDGIATVVQWIAGKIRPAGTDPGEPGEPSGPLPRRHEEHIRDQIRRATTPPRRRVPPPADPKPD